MKYRLYVLAAALLFSTGGAAVKATTLTSWQVASFRSAVAAVALMAFLPESRQVGQLRTWVAGVAYALTLVLFVLATKLTTAANAIFLQATAPFYLLAIGPLLLRETNKPRDYWLGLAIAFGMVLSLSDQAGASALAPNPVLGNSLAAVTGLTWALTVAGLRKFGGGLNVVGAGNVLAFGMALPFALPVASFGLADIGALLYLGFIQIGLAYFLITKAVQHVPAFETAALILLEPVMNPVWTYLLHGEKPGAMTIAGGAAIVTGTLIHAWAARGESDAPQGSSATNASISSGEM